MERVTVYSSHGTFICDKATGEVIDDGMESFDYESCSEHGKITKINVDEYLQNYQESIPDTVDILDVGVTFEDGHYIGPDLGFREDMKWP